MIRSLVIAMIAALVLLGCGDDRPMVVLYTSADECALREIVKTFEREHNIRIKYVRYSEANVTNGLFERLQAERNSPRADVLWSQDYPEMFLIAEAGLLEPYESATIVDWPEQFRDRDRRWYGFSARSRVIVYAPDRLTEDEVPQTWMDLTNHYFRGRIVMADPRLETTGLHFAAKQMYWEREFGQGYFEAYLTGLANNGIRMLVGGNVEVIRAVAAGEADLGMTDSHEVRQAIHEGKNVKLVYPRHEPPNGSTSGGTLLIPNTVGRVRGGPNADTAAVLIDFLLSEQSERILAASAAGYIPLRPSLSEHYQELHVPDSLRIDIHRVVERRAAAVALAMQMFQDNDTPLTGQ